MPALKIDRIISFSSEDKVHVANNLLGNKTTLKWKCATAGEKQATVCFQLDEPSLITGIDIGNEHSAYIEVLVSRSEMSGDYKSFLVMSSFMSAVESRQSTNINRVRMFKRADFSKPECDQKWDRIKIVCTQPFNRHIQYGLSFIKFHSSEEKENDGEKKLGKFTLRPESPVDLGNGSLFARRKEFDSEKDKPLSAAAAIRAATSSLLNDSSSSPVRSPKLLPSFLRNSTSKTKIRDVDSPEYTPKPRNRNELFYTEDEEKPNEKIDKLIEQKNAEKLKRMEENKNTPVSKNKTKTENKEKAKKDSEKKEKIDTTKDEPRTSKPDRESFKRKLIDVPDKSPKKMKPTKITKPFEKLLEDVVLVISGIQNPDRATLRGKILEMGAKYKPDWDSSCTHLVCAFMNTPKFNQVRGKGKIVTKQWVDECFSQKKKLPWRRYALDRQEKNKDESEDEICEKIDEEISYSPISEKRGQNLDFEDITEPASDTEDLIEQIQQKRTPKISKNKQETITNIAVISPEPTPHCSKQTLNISEEEIKNSPEIVEENKAYSAETDTDEETAERKLQVKKKPFDFFKTKRFFIDTNFEDYIDEMLRNYVFIHEGSLFDDPRENVDYIICGKDEAKNLSAANTKAICVLPDWIVDCHKCRQFIPPDEYFVL